MIQSKTCTADDGQEGARTVVDRQVSAAAQEAEGQEAGTGQQGHDQDGRQLGLPRPVEEPGECR